MAFGRQFHLRFSRRGLALVAVAFSLAGGGVRAEDLIEAKATEKSGVAIQLPKGWQADDHAGERTLLSARATVRDTDKGGEFQTLLMISADAGTKIDGAAQQARVAKDVANYKSVEKPEPVTINGLEGVKFGGTLTAGPLKLRTRQYMVLRADRIYTLTFMSLESRWAAYADAMDASAATFRMVK